jgi:hypothetical protein
MTDTLKDKIQTLHEIVSIRENSEVLMDTLVNLLTKVVHYCHEKNIPIENESSINTMLLQTRRLLQNLQNASPKSEHPKFKPEDGTEPNFLSNVITIADFSY